MERVGSSRMRWKALIVAVTMAGVAVAAQTPQQDPPAPVPPSPDSTVDAPTSFPDSLTGLIKEACDRGLSEALATETLEGLQPLERVIQSDRAQAELNPGFDRYLSARLTPAMVNRGKDLLAEHEALLERIENDFHVQ